MNVTLHISLCSQFYYKFFKVKFQLFKSNCKGVVIWKMPRNFIYFSSNSFVAKDAGTIERFIHMPKSKFVYVVMAQPLDETIPPFILQIFGAEATSNSRDVVNRWNFTKLELAK